MRKLPPEFLAPIVAEPRNWRDPQVGWGVVIPDGFQIPEVLRELIASRAKAIGTSPDALIYRYLESAPLGIRYAVLRNYAAKRDIAVEGAPNGVAADALPTYLLIVGAPTEIPWRLQYVLNATRCIGRVSLRGDALSNYISAVLRWDDLNSPPSNTAARQSHAVVWAVDHGLDDITHLMRESIAGPLVTKMRTDPQLSVLFVDGSATPATASSLLAALISKQPGLIVTTSHGCTGPLRDPQAMSRSLGLPVTSDGIALDAGMLEGWQPDGAIWYAHACCSAGSDASSNFAGLFDSESQAAQVLVAIETLGSLVAPLPTALLGAPRPLRAFIGHVEPTFDWTIELPATGQLLTSGLIEALYSRLYVDGRPNALGQVALASPIGYAMRKWFGRTAGLEAQRRVMESASAKDVDDEALLATSLATRDLESTVILGDPTMAIPPLVS
jgi:hypothetical protein